ncbi:MAG TPA: tetratricopeptide repeat protein, partial [Aquaticitalea sp.]|nr:tetratricopeptide repeat protein [Aquaticitalea sp.]
VTNENYIAAEKEFRKAISEQPDNVAGAYNLGNSYYKKGNYEEALFRQQQAAKNATSKDNKHKAFHNIGNILMKNKQCKEAVEAYKSALRNDPTDEETRYNLVIAKECAEQQKDEDQDKNKDKDKKEEEKDEEEKKDQDNKGDQDKKDGEDQKDKGQPEQDKQNPEQGDEKKEQQQQPQPGQLSPQQIKNLLEAMNNQEQKTQEKINAEKTKGVKVRTEKDW